MIQLPVTMDSAINRLNKRLEKDGLYLYRAREGSAKAKLVGKFFTVKLAERAAPHARIGGEVVKTHIDINSYARELGVLLDNEVIV